MLPLYGSMVDYTSEQFEMVILNGAWSRRVRILSPGSDFNRQSEKIRVYEPHDLVHDNDPTFLSRSMAVLLGSGLIRRLAYVCPTCPRWRYSFSLFGRLVHLSSAPCPDLSSSSEV